MSPFAGVLFLCFVSLSAAVNAESSGLISDLCRHSEDPVFCVSSLQTPPDSGERASTSNQVETIAISAASASASATSVYIKEKLRRQDLEPATEDTLEDCLKNYQDAAEQLDDSLAALLANSYADIDAWIDAAISAVETCGSALESRAGSDDELSRRNAVFFKLCKNAAMINKMLT
ncbi:PREDICTED: uncharacterized protein LOC104822713 [Tarenaya hassleriana]|uniref:uncharacterized protein LOC104822713 n=1 Tax=Tarenaya hassleriana TaxID=28532 RepID=UPI00053C8F38|nr:PREDICTED: uncharacterized protein LOC104822713 [Tarenaya hassleriana]